MKKSIMIGFLLLSQITLGQELESAQGANLVDIKTSSICEMCKEAIERDLTYTKGVKDVSLNLENDVVTVKYNPKKISPDEIRKRITLVGYDADSLKADPEAYKELPFCCRGEGAHED